MDDGSKALINEIPDTILCHILSFLPTKEAASTSVLSRRWRYLLAFVHNLDLDDSAYLNLGEWIKNQLVLVNNKRTKPFMSFTNFVDRILDLQCNFPIHKFSLKIAYSNDPDCVIPWVHNVLVRGVFDLNLHVDLKMKSPLPSRIFLSETLVRLSLNIRDGPEIDVEDVHLPNLKSLCLNYVSFKEKGVGFSKLLSGCHMLEEPLMNSKCLCSWISCSVTVTTLKRLTLRWLDPYRNTNNVSFDTPNLVYLEYTEVIARKYPKVNFNSLVEAKIDLQMTGDLEIDMFCNPTNFITGICNVRILCLSASTLEVLTLYCKAIPLFINLTHLTIESKPEFGWKSLPGLLKNCPNLETLVFKGLQHRATYRLGDSYLSTPWDKVEDEDIFNYLSSSRVKVLEILKFDPKKEMRKVKYFLKTMPNLEQLIIHYSKSVEENVVEVLRVLEMVPRRGLAKCKIQITL